VACDALVALATPPVTTCCVRAAGATTRLQTGGEVRYFALEEP
jgi:hypothetical protein